jgi:UDP-N-acetylglucosamine acyltransferase
MCPFVLIDQVIELEHNSHIIAIKNVSLNEPFFNNLFMEEPVLPESIIIEALQQAGFLLLSEQLRLSTVKTFFEAIKEIKFINKVRPGDQLRLEVEIKKQTDTEVKLNGKALVEGKVVSEGVFVFQLALAPSKPQIHTTASVHPSAVLGKDVVVGPYSTVGEDVVIGDRTILEAHALIEKCTRIGEDCHIHFGCVLGSNAQDRKYSGEKTYVVLGDRNILREYVTINRSTGAGTITQIGNDNMFLTNVHIGHNVVVHNNVTITNLTHIAGHVTIEDNVIIGGLVGMHQFLRVGKGAMVGGYSRIPQDVPPFMLVEGNPAYIRTPNLVGLKRRGASKEALVELKSAFKLFCRSNLNTSQAIAEMEKVNFKSEEAKYFLNFIKADSKRGLTKGEADTSNEQEPE